MTAQPEKIAFDSNALTYFVESFSREYDPSSDHSPLREERIALLRCFFYLDDVPFLLPEVGKEYQRIKSDDHKRLHAVTVSFQFNEVVWKLDEKSIDKLRREFFERHPKHSDCQILAEAEVAKMNILLSCDGDFLKKLAANTDKVCLLKPSLYWERLHLPKGCPIRIEPLEGHCLFGKDCWKW